MSKLIRELNLDNRKTQLILFLKNILYENCHAYDAVFELRKQFKNSKKEKREICFKK